MISDNNRHVINRQYMIIVIGDGEMKNKIRQPDLKVKVIRKKGENQIKEDLFELCIKKEYIIL